MKGQGCGVYWGRVMPDGTFVTGSKNAPLSAVNPVGGCVKYSEGCMHCYAERDRILHYADGNGKGFWGHPFSEVVLHPEQLAKFDKLAKARDRHVVFVGNSADLFQDGVPFEYIETVVNRMVQRDLHRHTFLLLTKRAQRMHDFFEWWGSHDTGHNIISMAAYPHIWLGVTAENQQRADERIPLLLDTPAAHRWVSVEPMLGPVNLMKTPCNACGECDDIGHIHGDDCSTRYLYHIDLVIAGGESGPGARPTRGEWFESLYGQCHAAGVRYVHKQDGDAYRDNPVSYTMDAAAFAQPFIGRVIA